ncbi:MAG: hypothetical protein ABL971_01620 [Vicinamibacterales bacterium]
MTMKPQRIVAILLVAAVTLNAACRTTHPTRSFTELPKYLASGDVVYVDATTGEKSTGSLIDLSPASLTILAREGRVQMPDTGISRIQRRQPQKRRGALIGLGVGFTLGVGLVVGVPPSGCPVCDAEAAALVPLVLGAWGAAAGAITGALKKAHRTVYEAP